MPYIVAMAVLFFGAVQAQTGDSMTGAKSGPSAPLVPTLASIENGIRTQDHTIVRLRRFRDGATVVAVRERVEVDANGSIEPAFALTFLGVVGELPGSPLTQKWQQTYSRFDRLLFLHNTFRVRDLQMALVNYSLHDFGPVTRAGRAARRLVVFPQAQDKAIWVIDVDVQTSIPIYSAEFDLEMRLLSEVEGESFSTTVGALPPVSASAGVTIVPDFAAAESLVGAEVGLLEPNTLLVSEYQLGRIEVRDDPLNGRQKVVWTYTDGVDEFMIVQTPNSPDLFSGLPAENATSLGNTIARYRDPALSVLLFWDEGVAFQVAGRGSLRRLDELARLIYLQALSN